MTPADARAAAAALQAYTLGLLGFTGVKVLAPAFFAQQDTKTPVRFATVAVGSNIALNLLLIGPLAHVGLALATGLAALLQAGLLARALLRRGDWAPAPGLTRFCFALLQATSAMALALVLALPDTGFWFAASPWFRGAALAGLVALGLTVYTGALTLLGYGPRWLRALLSQ